MINTDDAKAENDVQRREVAFFMFFDLDRERRAGSMMIKLKVMWK